MCEMYCYSGRKRRKEKELEQKADWEHKQEETAKKKVEERAKKIEELAKKRENTARKRSKSSVEKDLCGLWRCKFISWLFFKCSTIICLSLTYSEENESEPEINVCYLTFQDDQKEGTGLEWVQCGGSMKISSVNDEDFIVSTLCHLD